MTTARAETVELETVGLNDESIARGDFFLKLFNFAVFKLDDLAATGANEVIVVALMRDVIVLGLRPEVPGLGDSRIAKQVQCPVNGGQSEMWISFSQLVIHSFGRDMFLPEKRREDEFALAGELQLVLA
jgi:hypothetical protein